MKETGQSCIRKEVISYKVHTLETGVRRSVTLTRDQSVGSEASAFNINNEFLLKLKIFRKKMKLFGAYLPIFLAIGLAIVLLECEAGRRGGGGM